MNAMSPMLEVYSGGNESEDPDAQVIMVLPAGSTTVKSGHTGVVYSVRIVMTVAGTLGFVVCLLPHSTTSVEIQMTATTTGGCVTVVVKPGSVTVTGGHCWVVVTFVYGGRTTVQGNSHVIVGSSVFQI